jgi:RND superfamily putative drug exporter
MPNASAPPDRSTRLANLISRRWRWFVVAWATLLVLAGASAVTIAGNLSGGGWYVHGSGSDAAATKLQTGFTGRGKTTATLVVHDRRHTVADPAFATRVQAVVDDVRHDAQLHVTGISGWTTLTGSLRKPYLGKDHRTVVHSVAIDLDDGTARRELPAIEKRISDRYKTDGIDASLVSPASFWGEVNSLSQSSLAKAEMITAPLTIIILLLLFRSLASVAAALASGITGIVFTLGLLGIVARHLELSVFVQNAATMIGLGVGIDYSLFMISRFKEQLDRGQTVTDAVAGALRTAGHTIVASGGTIVLAMCALFLIKLNVIFSITLGVVVVVAFSVLTSTLFLPVLLHLLGHRINAGRLRLPGRRTRTRLEDSRWYRISEQVMKRPVVFLTVVAAGLLALASPAVKMQIFSPDARILSSSSSVRTGYERIQDAFGDGATSPIQVVVTAPTQVGTASVDRELAGLQNRLEHLPHVARVDSAEGLLKGLEPTARDGAEYQALNQPVYDTLHSEARQVIHHYVSADKTEIVFEVVPDSPSSTSATRDLLTDVRDTTSHLSAGMTAVVGGETAEDTDANKVIQDGLIPVVAVMLIAVYLVLLATFRSLLLPLKAIAMNLLSISATYGVLVLVFQNGYGTELLHFDHTGYLQNFIPVLLLALLFSLATDYEVFLLDRVREEYVATGDNTTSVSRGLTRTAPLISGAAILMVAVFGAFGFAGLVPIQQLGFGLALAVLIDATLVRLLLVPAAMRLMGRANWWMPGRPDPARARNTATGSHERKTVASTLTPG